MVVYAYVRKGLHHKNGVCQDTVLLDHVVVSGGVLKLELSEDFMIGVADGVGGENAGEVASSLAMSALARCDARDMGIEEVKRTLCFTNETIREIAGKTEICGGMASTFVGMFCRGMEGYVLWAGNSRLYQVTEGDGGNIQQLTVDHNVKNEWLESGRIDSPEQIENGEALTVYMGMPAAAFSRRLEAEQIYLPGTRRIFLTSDGIHDHIPEQQMREWLTGGEPGEALLPKLAEAALENGSTDDMSVVMLEWEAAAQ